MSDLSPLFDWRSAVASKFGPEKPITRHVLLTLSLWMSAKGDSCYPSQETVAEATKLTVKTVRTHLQIAEELGWLRRDAHGFGGQGWRRYEYAARVPGHVMHALMDEKRAVTDTPRSAEAGVPGTSPSMERGVNDDQKVGYPVPMSASVEDVSSNGDLFEEGEHELTLEVRSFCLRIGVTKWPLRSTTLEAWCRKIELEVEYAGLDLPAETRKCGDHWEPKNAKGKKAAPHMRLRNWYGIAAERNGRNNGTEGAPETDVARLHDMLGG